MQEKLACNYTPSSRSGATDDGYLLSPDRRPLAEKKLLRRIDIRLMPTIVMIYVMNNVNRSAITSARLKGLDSDLRISDLQYNIILAIFFAFYSPAQIPSNMILNRCARPSLYIGSCVALWGLISTLTGVTKNFIGLLICRIFLAFPEAAFYPGCVYLLSRWYTRRELAVRVALLYGGYVVSNAFGSLMAAGILGGMEGVLGIRAWRWLFYIEGAATIFIGLQAIWLLPDFPYNTRWLSPAERRLARARIAADAGEADEDSKMETPWQGLKLALQDPKVWIFAVMKFCALLGLGFVNFVPTLTATLGFSTTVTLLVAAPPWVIAAILCAANARHADKSGERFCHIALWWSISVTGYIIAMSTMSIPARYMSLFFLSVGFVGDAMTLVWVSNSIPRPPSKRAAGIAMVNGFGNIGNLVSAFVWEDEWSPQYRPSMIIGISCLIFAILLALVLRKILMRENKYLDRLEDEDHGLRVGEQVRIEEAAKIEGITIEEAMKRKRVFRYLY